MIPLRQSSNNALVRRKTKKEIEIDKLLKSPK